MLMSLNGTWELRDEALAVLGESGAGIVGKRGGKWLDATVPGEVHWDLHRAGKMPEPLHSLNAADCRWPEDRSWWYRKTVVADPEMLSSDRIELVCEGVDYFGQVFLNGRLVGECENALVPAVFDLAGHLQEGANELLIRVTAGTERAANQETGERTPDKPYAHRQSFKGIRELRKPQFTYGWDWVDALPNIGLWRDVSVRYYRKIRLNGFRHDVTLCGAKAVLQVDAEVENLHPWSEYACRVTGELITPDGVTVTAKKELMAQSGIQVVRLEFEVEQPRLWWPNGMGEPNLHQLRLEVAAEDEVTDEQETRIGLRTVSIDRSALPQGHRFAIRINGEDVFCRGGNWIPADAIIARGSADKLEELVRIAAEANFNMLRVWGGGVYEADAFYDACDRYGILVWQDFAFACSTYPDDSAAFREAVREEAVKAVRRLRNHPSLALWCGNNENTWGFADWWNKGKSFPDKGLSLGGHIVYNEIIPRVCAAEDGSRPYWPSSPFGGKSPNGEDEGDCHWWTPGTMNEDISRRYRHEIYDECRGRFVSEYGVIGPCHLDSLKQALAPDELRIGSEALNAHTNFYEKSTLPAAIRHHYTDPEGLPMADYIRYGQMFQAWMYGHSLESMRFRKHDAVDDCAGALIWMYNDCWCEIGWTPVDYYLKRKASYYWIRNAFYPVRAIVRRRNNALVTRLINDSPKAIDVTVVYGWLPVDGTQTEARLQKRKLHISANAMLEVASAEIPAEEELPPESWLYAAWCEADGVEPLPCVWTLCPHRQMTPVHPEIAIRRDGAELILSSKVYCHGVAFDDGGEHVFSDNYFDLLPGLDKRIRCVRECWPDDIRFTSLPYGAAGQGMGRLS